MAKQDLLGEDHWPTISGPRAECTYMIYVDDSGDSQRDLLSAVCIPVGDWAEVLKAWKAFRRWLHKKHELPPTVELHGEELLARGIMHSIDHATGEICKVPERIDLPGGGSVRRSRAFNRALKTLGSFESMRVLTCFAPVANGSGNLYEDVLLPWLNDWLAFDRSWGIVCYDGTDASLIEMHRASHRNLPYERRVIEDAGHQASHHSHFIQMADLCVHAAFKTIRADDGDETRKEVCEAYDFLRDCVVPGSKDTSGFPDHWEPRGIRGYPASP